MLNVTKFAGHPAVECSAEPGILGIKLLGGPSCHSLQSRSSPSFSLSRTSHRSCRIPLQWYEYRCVCCVQDAGCVAAAAGGGRVPPPRLSTVRRARHPRPGLPHTRLLQHPPHLLHLRGAGQRRVGAAAAHHVIMTTLTWSFADCMQMKRPSVRSL